MLREGFIDISGSYVYDAFADAVGYLQLDENGKVINMKDVFGAVNGSQDGIIHILARRHIWKAMGQLLSADLKG